MNFTNVLLLWKQYNILMGNIIVRADRSKLENCWIKPDGDRKKLKDLMINYVGHLKDHLRHFEQTLEETNRMK